MPLNLSNRDQNSGHLFYNRRLKAAITRFSVRMKHDDRKQQAAVALSVVFVLIGIGWMALLHVMKPAGLAGQSQIIGNRDTGALYAKINGRLYPALNLTSARLAVGSAAVPAWVKAAEIARYPTGPTIGIPGAPDELSAAGDSTSAWAVCDTAPTRGGSVAPVVTAIAGQLSAYDRAAPLRESHAILVTHRGVDYVVWGGHRSQIESTDRSLTFNLGLDPGETRAVEISNALFDAMPATEPLVPPRIADTGSPSRWIPDATVGSVLEVKDATGASTFYALLAGGVQKISGFVADLLRTADVGGAASPKLVAPATVIGIPAVHDLDVDYYPTGKLHFVDTAANPVSCVQWAKQSGDPQASITIVNGHGLPVPADMDARLVTLVRDDRTADSVEADRTLLLPDAANLVVTTSGAPVADSRENLYWVSPQGVRYGIEADRRTLAALGLDPRRAVQAPWPLLRTFAAGPAISRDSALLARDTVTAGAAVAAVPDTDEQPGG